MSKCGLLYDPVFLKHKTGAGHPEQPKRVSRAHQAIVEAGLDQKILLYPVPHAKESIWRESIRIPTSCRQKKTSQMDSPN